MSCWTSMKGAGRTPGIYWWQLAVIESYMTRRSLGCEKPYDTVSCRPALSVASHVHTPVISRIYAASSAAVLSILSVARPARGFIGHALLVIPFVLRARHVQVQVRRGPDPDTVVVVSIDLRQQAENAGG